MVQNIFKRPRIHIAPKQSNAMYFNGKIFFISYKKLRLIKYFFRGILL